MAEHTKKNIKVAFYIRVSTDEQAEEGTSLEVQREYLEDYVNRDEHKKAGWQIYYPEPGKIYEDDGYSGYNLNRPALRKLLADAKKNKFDLILVHKIDRFSRNLREMLNIIHELELNDIAFKSASEFYDTTTSQGRLLLQQLGSFAEFERNRIKERVFPGMIKGVEKGHWQGSRYAPYGYSYDTDLPEDKRRLEVVKEEADIVRMIFTMYLSGNTTTQIAGYLYKKDYKTRSGGRFHSKLVCDILKNQVYLGMIVWNKHHYDTKQRTLKGFRYVRNDPSKVVISKGKHEPIISQEDFDAVQKKLEANRKGVSARKGCKEYPLSGILVCAKCGHNLQGGLCNASKNKNWTKRYYRCSGKAVHDIDCHAPYITSDKAEAEVFTILDVVLNNPSLAGKRIENIIAAASSVHNEEIEREMTEWKLRLDSNLSKQQRLSQVFTDGYLAMEVFKKQIEPLRIEERQVKDRIQRLQVALIEREKSDEYLRLLKAVVNHFDYIEDHLDIAGKKGLLKLVFKRITIEDGKIKGFELFEPFKSFYEGAEIKWEIPQVQESQAVAKLSQSLHMAARWLRYRGTMERIAEAILRLD